MYGAKDLAYKMIDHHLPNPIVKMTRPPIHDGITQSCEKKSMEELKKSIGCLAASNISA